VIKVLLDEGLSWHAVDLLQSAGIDAVHVHEIGLLSATDEKILQAARDQNRVIFTLDHDFHQILAIQAKESPSVVFLRFEHLNAIATARIVAAVLRTRTRELAMGAMISVSPGSIRVRKLPLHRR